MAKKMDDEFLKDSRAENKKQAPKNEQGETIPNTETPNSEEKIFAANTEPNNNQGANTQAPEQEKINSEFREKFDEYFKGAGSMIAGASIVEMIDDLKSNLLFIYAKKQGVDVPKEALKMDSKSKELTAFLVDYAIKNKLFSVIEKYPLLGAVGVIGISSASSFLFIKMMAQGKTENQKLKEEIEALKKKRTAEARENAEEITPENETDLKDFAKKL